MPLAPPLRTGLISFPISGSSLSRHPCDGVRHTWKTRWPPSIDLVVFFKLQLVRFFEDIRSERLLMRVVVDLC